MTLESYRRRVSQLVSIVDTPLWEVKDIYTNRTEACDVDLSYWPKATCADAKRRGLGFSCSAITGEISVIPSIIENSLTGRQRIVDDKACVQEKLGVRRIVKSAPRGKQGRVTCFIK